MLDLLFDSPAKRGDVSQYGWQAWWPSWARRKTLAGPMIDEEKALCYAAVWCATRVIAEGCASLPLPLYQRLGNGDRRQAFDHPSYLLLKLSPNPRMGATAFREGRTSHQVNWGNGFAEIDRRADGRPAALWPIHASRVSPNNYGDAADRFAYLVRNNDGTRVPMEPNEVLHLPGVISDDGIWGKGVIAYARESVGFGLGVERHGAGFFGSGAQPKGVLTIPGLRDKEARGQFRAEWKEVHGSPDSGEVAILPVDGKYQPTTMTNEDAQFLETRKLNITDIARWYRIPPHMLGDLERATFSNIEQMSLEFVIYSLLPWLRRQEDEYNRKLLLPQEQAEYYFEHNLSGLLRGDIASRMAAYQIALQNGIMTINEVRRLENLNGIGPAGDQSFVPLNMTTADRMLAGIPAKPDPATAAAMFDEWTRFAITQRHPHDEPKRGRKSARLRSEIRDAARDVFAEALRRIFAKEANAVRRLVKDADFETELTGFHEKQAAAFADELQAACRTMAVAGIAADASQLAASVANRSRAALLAAYDSQTPEQFAALLDAWGDSRKVEEISLLFEKETADAAA